MSDQVVAITANANSAARTIVVRWRALVRETELIPQQVTRAETLIGDFPINGRYPRVETTSHKGACAGFAARAPLCPRQRLTTWRQPGYPLLTPQR
jgi:hypothetical protein